jgi:hypothetical protein
VVHIQTGKGKERVAPEGTGPNMNGNRSNKQPHGVLNYKRMSATYTHTHTHIHTQQQSQLHTHTHLHTRAHTHTHTHKHTHNVSRLNPGASLIKMITGVTRAGVDGQCVWVHIVHVIQWPRYSAVKGAPEGHISRAPGPTQEGAPCQRGLL